MPEITLAAKKSARPSRIGPSDGCEIIWPPSHGAQRLEERILSYGISKGDFEALIRSPNVKKKDDADPSRGRFRRWVAVDLDGARSMIRVVYEVSRPRTETDLGSITVVTVLVENSSSPKQR